MPSPLQYEVMFEDSIINRDMGPRHARNLSPYTWYPLSQPKNSLVTHYTTTTAMPSAPPSSPDTRASDVSSKPLASKNAEKLNEVCEFVPMLLNQEGHRRASVESDASVPSLSDDSVNEFSDSDASPVEDSFHALAARLLDSYHEPALAMTPCERSRLPVFAPRSALPVVLQEAPKGLGIHGRTHSSGSCQRAPKARPTRRTTNVLQLLSDDAAPIRTQHVHATWPTRNTSLSPQLPTELAAPRPMMRTRSATEPSCALTPLAAPLRSIPQSEPSSPSLPEVSYFLDDSDDEDEHTMAGLFGRLHVRGASLSSNPDVEEADGKKRRSLRKSAGEIVGRVFGVKK